MPPSTFADVREHSSAAANALVDENELKFYVKAIKSVVRHETTAHNHANELSDTEEFLRLDPAVQSLFRKKNQPSRTAAQVNKVDKINKLMDETERIGIDSPLRRL